MVTADVLPPAEAASTHTRRVALWFLSTAAVVTLLLGYKTSTSGPTPPTTSTVAVASRSTTAPSTGTATSGTAKAVTGSVAQTRWGPVQVQITVTGGKPHTDVVEIVDATPEVQRNQPHQR